MQSIVVDSLMVYLLVCWVLVFLLPMVLVHPILEWVRQGAPDQEDENMTRWLTSTRSIGLVLLIASVPLFGEQLTGLYLLVGFIVIVIVTWIGTWLAMKKVH
ncbi:MAG: hypothetical protein EAX95_15695 [Candidatus Thorarchaeota archaeon]|nr:hypothetical protein [Candidatus Thorarchaeota archaeon]